MPEQVNDQLAAALAAFQAELPRIGKGNRATVKSEKGQYSYNFADLADVSAVVLPAIAKHGLSWLAKPTLVGDRFVLAYKLKHVSGEEETGEYPLPSPTAPPQQLGSAITYARRYTLCSATGAAPDEDDDGQAAQRAHAQPYRSSQSGYGEAPEPDELPVEPAKPVSQEEKARIAASVVEGLLALSERDKVKQVWHEVHGGPVADLDVSGLLTTDQREVLGTDGEPVSLEQLVVAVGEYVKRHGQSVVDAAAFETAAPEPEPAA